LAADTATAREYELVLMLDPEIPEERREQIASEARSRIESGGTLKHDTGWGMRKLAYEIRQRTEADYRFFRFETQGGLLDDLNHNLRIADGVLRFRIFKVDPRSPAIVPPSAVATSGGTGRGGRRPQASEREAPAAEAPDPKRREDEDEPAEPTEEQTAGGSQDEPPPPSGSEAGGPQEQEEPEPESSQDEGSEPAAR
jgi:small subunit ribosomal protein S6